MNEILTVLIVMVWKYDMTPVQGGWMMPEMKSHITTSILTPVKDVEVRLRQREDTMGVQCTFTWKEGDCHGTEGLRW